jgi:hypothetical protein
MTACINQTAFLYFLTEFFQDFICMLSMVVLDLVVDSY